MCKGFDRFQSRPWMTRIQAYGGIYTSISLLSTRKFAVGDRYIYKTPTLKMRLKIQLAIKADIEAFQPRAAWTTFPSPER